ncbi:MAG: hypothetical protein LBB98_15065 [Treponema sp.]|nr:hypothetical protein [Treponema sp.]
MGLVSRSSGMTYGIIQKAIATGFGICGVIGLVVVPIQMFFEDRAKSGGTGDAAE